VEAMIGDNISPLSFSNKQLRTVYANKMRKLYLDIKRTGADQPTLSNIDTADFNGSYRMLEHAHSSRLPQEE
jgi:hypothetical protein